MREFYHFQSVQIHKHLEEDRTGGKVLFAGYFPVEETGVYWSEL
jgi:hypothetical protein